MCTVPYYPHFLYTTFILKIIHKIYRFQWLSSLSCYFNDKFSFCCHSHSLGVWPFKFGLGFTLNRFPFCFVQRSCSPYFYAHFLQVWSNTIHPPYWRDFPPSPLIFLFCLPVTSFSFLQYAQAIPIYILQLLSVRCWVLLTKFKHHLPWSATLCSQTVLSDSFNYLLKTWEPHVIWLHYYYS